MQMIFFLNINQIKFDRIRIQNEFVGKFFPRTVKNFPSD